MNRRHFLTGLGLTAGSLFLPSLLPSAAADESVPPQRLVVVFTQHGTVYDAWRMRPPGMPADGRWTHDLASAAEADFGPALAPLHPWRRRLAIIDGLALVSGEVDPAVVLRHEIGQVHALTGGMVEMVAGLPMASAASIDQRVADVIARPDRLRSLEIGIGSPPMSVNYRDRLQLLPYERHPHVVWQRLFGLASGRDLSPVELEQGSVLDRVRERYALLHDRLSGEDRRKIEVHRDLVRDLEIRIDGLMQASCAATPELPAGGGDYGHDTAVFTQLVTAALACDLTRVVTLHFGDIPAERLGHPGTGVHDEFAHGIWTEPLAAEVMTRYTSHHANDLVALLGALDAIPEGNGTMLDHTTCLWVGELGDGAHGFEHWPVVVAGGRGLRLGQYIHYPSQTPVAGWWWDGTRLPAVGVPHQRLLTTLGRAFGVTEADGSTLRTMPVREVVGIEGETVDCTGILEELHAS